MVEVQFYVDFSFCVPLVRKLRVGIVAKMTLFS